MHLAQAFFDIYIFFKSLWNLHKSILLFFCYWNRQEMLGKFWPVYECNLMQKKINSKLIPFEAKEIAERNLPIEELTHLSAMRIRNLIPELCFWYTRHICTHHQLVVFYNLLFFLLHGNCMTDFFCFRSNFPHLNRPTFMFFELKNEIKSNKTTNVDWPCFTSEKNIPNRAKFTDDLYFKS